MEDDILLAGVKANSKNPARFRILDKSYSADPYALMFRREDPDFKALVDETLIGLMESGAFTQLYTKWFETPIPPRNLNLNFPMSRQAQGIDQHTIGQGELLIPGHGHRELSDPMAVTVCRSDLRGGHLTDHALRLDQSGRAAGADRSVHEGRTGITLIATSGTIPRQASKLHAIYRSAASTKCDFVHKNPCGTID